MLTVVHTLLDRFDPGIYGWKMQRRLLFRLGEQEKADVGKHTDALLPLRTEEALSVKLEVRRVVSVDEVGREKTFDQLLVLFRQVVFL